jgi:hypothetical protein
MTHRISISLVAGAIALSAAAVASTTKPLERVSIAEGSAAFVDVDRIGGPRDLDEGLRKQNACIEAVDAAIAAGSPASTVVKVYNSRSYPHGKRVKKPGYTAKHYAPIGEIRTGCQARVAKLRVLPTIWGIKDVIAQAKALAVRKKVDRYSTIPAKMAYDKCVAGVKRTLALGAPKSEKIEVEGHTMTLGEATEKGCGIVKTAIEAATKKAEKAHAAKYAPYKKALRGDKWKVFMKYKMITFRVRGRGGRELSTPRKLARSSVWFERLRSRSYRRWRMKRFKFRGNRLVSVRIVSGRGRIPPSRAYR